MKMSLFVKTMKQNIFCYPKTAIDLSNYLKESEDVDMNKSFNVFKF